jgi:hypothetical protein
MVVLGGGFDMGKILKRKNTWSYFNGTSYIEYADNDVFSFTDGVNDIPFEIEFDVYLPTSQPDNVIINKRDATPNVEWIIGLVASKIRVSLSTASTSNYIRQTSNLTLLSNTLYHIKIIYNGSKDVNDIKIFTNGVQDVTTSSVGGTYTGMINTNSDVIVGKNYVSTGILTGYLRNLKIKKNNQFVFFAPLQDTNAVSTDVIGGLVHNAGVLPTVVNKLESERWAYFDGLTSQLSIGTTSTLGWMNSGTFRMTFDIKQVVNTAAYYIRTASTTLTSYGFHFIVSSDKIVFRWTNGSGSYGANILGGIIVAGTNYRFTVQGDGTQIRYIQDNLDTGANLYDSGFLACTYIPNATTATALLFCSPVGGNIQLKNFTIYTDTAGTQPFLSLPFQNPDTISVDTVGGLVGTNTNVRLINNNENVLKSRNSWSYFNGTTSYIQYTDNDVFSFTDGVNDIPFDIEFDLYSTLASVAQNIVSKGATSPNEYMIKLNSSLLYVRMWSAPNYIGVYVTTTLKINQLYHIKVTYNGSKLWTGIKIYFDNVEQLLTNSSSGVYTGMVNSSQPLYVGAQDTSNNFFQGYLRNLKITKAGQLIFFTPLQDTNAVSKDVIGGLVHNGGVLPTVVNKLESERWGYFDGVSSALSIGTTSTLGWMNSGVFNMEFDIKFLNSIGSKTIIHTAAGVSNYGFRLYWFNNNIYVYYYNGITIAPNVFILLSFVLGDSNKIIIRGDGIKLYYTVYNYNNTVKQTNEPIGVNYTFIPNVTTQVALTFNSTDFQLKNFKIYTDTDGTQPFLSLPFQNPDAITTDTIGGLVGTNTNVRLINNMENVMKDRSLWCVYPRTSNDEIYDIGTVSDFNYIHKTGIFRIEFDFIFIENFVEATLIQNTISTATAGVHVWFTTNRIYFRIYRSVGGTFAFNILSGIQLTINTKYYVQIFGDGNNVYIYVNNILYSSQARLNTFDTINNAGVKMCIGSDVSLNNYRLKGYMKNVKFYNSTDCSKLTNWFTLTDKINISKDIIGGLSGTVGSNISVIDI